MYFIASADDYIKAEFQNQASTNGFVVVAISEKWLTVVLSCGSERKKVHGIWPSPSLDTIFSESEFIKIKIF